MTARVLAHTFLHYLARTACSLSGGLTVTGQTRREGGCVVMADHGSHSDTRMLLAAVPPRAKPMFAASSDCAIAKRALAQGRTVVVYPEKTGATDESIRELAARALRLASENGAPVVPAALLHTSEAKRRRFSPTPKEVRFGEAGDPTTTTPEEAERQLTALRDGHPLRTRESRVWLAVAGLIAGPYSMLVAFVWGFAEAVSWFIVAEMALVLLPAAVPRKVMPWAAALIPGSVLGVVTTAWLASRGVLLPAPLTTPRMAATAFGQLAAGPSAMLNQALSGIPVKVYARAAGEHGIGLWSLAGWTLLERGLRISMVALVVRLVSHLLEPWLRRLYGVYLIAVAVLFTVALSAVIAAWS